MNISVIGRFNKEDFGEHIAGELEKIGHSVDRFNFGVNINYEKNNKNSTVIRGKKIVFELFSKYSTKTRNYITSKLVQHYSNKKFDLIICTYDWLLDYEVELIKKHTKAKIVLWYPDALVNFGRSFFMSANYDALFFKDSYIVENLKKIYNKNVYYLPECFSPEYHKPVEYNKVDEEKYECDVSLIGNLHPYRVELLKLLDKNINIKVFGSSNPWWLNINKIQKYYTGEYLTYLEKSKAIRYTKISLNTVHIGEINGVNVRTFELAGSGGFQIIQWKKDLEDLFEIDKEIVTFNSLNELKEKIEYYINNDHKREQIAKAGLERAIKDHTYNKRLHQLISIVFSNKNPWE